MLTLNLTAVYLKQEAGQSLRSACDKYQLSYEVR